MLPGWKCFFPPSQGPFRRRNWPSQRDLHASPRLAVAALGITEPYIVKSVICGYLYLNDAFCYNLTTSSSTRETILAACHPPPCHRFSARTCQPCVYMAGFSSEPPPPGAHHVTAPNGPQRRAPVSGHLFIHFPVHVFVSLSWPPSTPTSISPLLFTS